MAASTQADLLGNRYGHLAYRRRGITHPTTGSTATRVLLPQESGAIFYVPKVSTAKFALPLPSSRALGLTYEFHIAAQDTTGDIQVVSTGNSSVLIVGVALTSASSAITDVQSASLPTTQANYGKFTLVSSIVWQFESNIQITNDYTSGAILREGFRGDWTTGTTV